MTGSPDSHPYNRSINVLILCTANQCRSPMAEGLLRARAAEAGVAVNVSSAGVMHGGAPATADAVDVLAELGIDISTHVSRRLDRDMLGEADLVLTMTRDHLREAVVTDPSQYAAMIRLWNFPSRLPRSLSGSDNDRISPTSTGLTSCQRRLRTGKSSGKPW